MQQWHFAIICVHKYLPLQNLTGMDLPYLVLVQELLENFLHV